MLIFEGYVHNCLNVYFNLSKNPVSFVCFWSVIYSFEKFLLYLLDKCRIISERVISCVGKKGAIKMGKGGKGLCRGLCFSIKDVKRVYAMCLRIHSECTCYHRHSEAKSDN